MYFGAHFFAAPSMYVYQLYHDISVENELQTVYLTDIYHVNRIFDYGYLLCAHELTLLSLVYTYSTNAPQLSNQKIQQEPIPSYS